MKENKLLRRLLSVVFTLGMVMAFLPGAAITAHAEDGPLVGKVIKNGEITCFNGRYLVCKKLLRKELDRLLWYSYEFNTKNTKLLFEQFFFSQRINYLLKNRLRINS